MSWAGTYAALAQLLGLGGGGGAAPAAHVPPGLLTGRAA